MCEYGLTFDAFFFYSVIGVQYVWNMCSPMHLINTLQDSARESRFMFFLHSCSLPMPRNGWQTSQTFSPLQSDSSDSRPLNDCSLAHHGLWLVRRDERLAQEVRYYLHFLGLRRPEHRYARRRHHGHRTVSSRAHDSKLSDR